DVRMTDTRPVAAAARPVIRPAAAVAPAQVAPQPAPVAQAPVMQAPKAVDPIAETIRQAEAEMERELAIAEAPRQAAPQPVAQAEPEFRPQSRIFAAAPADAPVLRPATAPVMYSQSAPVAPQPAPRMMPSEPAPSMAMEPVRMPKVEDFPPVVKGEMDLRAHSAQHV